MSSKAKRFERLVSNIRDSKLPPPSVRRETREAVAVSIREAAEELGVAPMTFLRWERGDAQPRRDHAIAYRQFLDALRQVDS